ncbi:unnamed protein product [Cyprideis torosa]|uniref:non-specific protein-tyrosine kinase n=1 Tax=Cyprideis torosa TaxID=163714 RepID=A0A7R8WF02_9CRUS|nr:unnamed protein product [Cyprideis torosa]CAG0894909.1 unnamed protein product [Cyprideis torosa]
MGERGLGLYEFLEEAELQQYYSAFKTQLKVQNVSQLKYVTDEDLAEIGFSKPESRRLKTFFQKHFPQTYLSKFKKKFSFKREDQSLQGSPVPPPRMTKPQVKVPSKHIIPIGNFEPQGRHELAFRNGDIITVPDKRPETSGASCIVWKEALPSGRTGFFNPSHTITYLGSQIPSSSNREGAFPREDGKNMYSSRRRLRPEMISGPQGEVLHTGHVGIDGSFFGDVPKQVVAIFRPEPPSEVVLKKASSDVSNKAPLLIPTGEKEGRNGPASGKGQGQRKPEQPCVLINLTCDIGNEISARLLGNSRPATALGLREDGGMGSSMGSLKSGSHQLHDYLEISDREEAGNSPQFETMLDLSGPFLMEEVFPALSSGVASKRDEDGAKGDKKESTPIHSRNETTNVRNGLKEMAWKALRRGKRRKGDQMKPMSVDEEEALESAISIVRELAAKNLHDLFVA